MSWDKWNEEHKGSAKQEYIKSALIRLAKKKEIKSEFHRSMAMRKIPDKEGFDVGYKPYGEQGKGFYYTKK